VSLSECAPNSISYIPLEDCLYDTFESKWGIRAYRFGSAALSSLFACPSRQVATAYLEFPERAIEIALPALNEFASRERFL
jgi:hypothetical protein